MPFRPTNEYEHLPDRPTLLFPREMGKAALNKTILLAIAKNGSGKIEFCSSESSTTLIVHNDDSYVVKMPNDPENINERVKLQREGEMVVALTNLQGCPVDLPSIRDMPTEFTNQRKHTPYIAFDYVPGITGNSTSHKEGLGPSLTFGERTSIGKKLGEFTSWLSAALPADDPSTHNRLPLPPSEARPAYDADVLFSPIADFSDSDFPTLSLVAKQLAAEKKIYFPGLIADKECRVIHGDMRLPNLILKQNEKGDRYLHTILDLGSMRFGSLEEELLRPYIHLGAEGIQTMANTLTARGEYVNPGGAVWWHKALMVRTLIHRTMNHSTDKLALTTPADELRAAMYQYFPEEDWSELDKLMAMTVY